MPQIDFHVLSDNSPDAHWRYTCRIAEHAVDEGQRVFIRVASAEDAKRLDELLWTFGDRSFLPHEIATDRSPTHPLIKVLIGDAGIPDAFTALVINCGSGIPQDVAALSRVIELVPADTERKRAARERYKQYRDGGMEPTTQNIG